MNFNTHYDLKGQHAFLSPSKYYWLNWDEEKLKTSYANQLAILRGTRLHEYAAESISLGIKLQNNKTTLNSYVNDAIGYGMTPEQPLYYSPNCFGTSDAILFNERRRLLRIHDLKTGLVSPGSMRQLEIYTALFCLEYNYNPHKIKTNLRIYQFDDVREEEPEPDDIEEIMYRIREYSGIVDDLGGKGVLL